MENKTIPISFNWWHAIINYRITKPHTIINYRMYKTKGKRHNAWESNQSKKLNVT